MNIINPIPYDQGIDRKILQLFLDGFAQISVFFVIPAFFFFYILLRATYHRAPRYGGVRTRLLKTNFNGVLYHNKDYCGPHNMLKRVPSGL